MLFPAIILASSKEIKPTQHRFMISLEVTFDLQ